MSELPPITFHRRRRRGVPGALAGLAAATAGAMVLATHDDWRTGAVALGFGLFLILWLGQPLWRRVVLLRVDAHGVTLPLAGVGRMAWPDVVATRCVRHRGRAFLAVERTPAARRAAPLPPLLRGFAAQAHVDDVAWPLDGLDRQPEVIAAVVAELWQRAGGHAQATFPTTDAAPPPSPPTGC
jgi:hypothetical protein